MILLVERHRRAQGESEAQRVGHRARSEGDILPGSTVVGEEAVSADRSVLNRLSGDGDVWLVDPVDGTADFADGRQPFAVMVALVRAGRTVASCILDPVTGIAATAEYGAGAYLGGTRAVSPPAGPSRHRTTRAVGRPLHAGQRPQAGGRLGPLVGAVLPGRNCAGYEYPAIVRDEQQFAFFWRMLPWDHAPGILFLEEAGGVAWHLDGTPYEPTAAGLGVLAAQNANVWQTVRTTLLADIALPS